MLVSLTVGKVDAGVAVLLTEDKRLIEFPAVLLPQNISSGSIVDITVSRNVKSEAAAESAFAALQSEIYETFGRATPSAPVLRCRNATQTSIVLEWDPIQLATSDLRSLSMYRDGSKAGSIPRPLEIQSTKISGLAVDTQYTFQLMLRTSSGTYSSEKLTVRTHKMTDLSGITVTPGIMPTPLRDSLQKTVERIGAKLNEAVRIDTTHFVCTEGKGPAWEKAAEMNIPVVVPDWLHACEREGRIVGVRGYYLNADPRLRQVGQGVAVQQQARQSQQQDQLSRKQAQQSHQQRPIPLREASKREEKPFTPKEAAQETPDAAPSEVNGLSATEQRVTTSGESEHSTVEVSSNTEKLAEKGKGTDNAENSVTSPSIDHDDITDQAQGESVDISDTASQETVKPTSADGEKFDEVSL